MNTKSPFALSDDEKAARAVKVVKARNDGLTFKQLAGRFGRSEPTLKRILDAARDRGEVVR